MAVGSRSSTLTIKQLAAIVGLWSVLTGGITSAVAWVHADITVPKILNQTAAQGQKAIDRHSAQQQKALDRHVETTHEGALTTREFEIWADQVIKRLDRNEDAIREKH